MGGKEPGSGNDDSETNERVRFNSSKTSSVKALLGSPLSPPKDNALPVERRAPRRLRLRPALWPAVRRSGGISQGRREPKKIRRIGSREATRRTKRSLQSHLTLRELRGFVRALDLFPMIGHGELKGSSPRPRVGGPTSHPSRLRVTRLGIPPCSPRLRAKPASFSQPGSPPGSAPGRGNP